MNSDKEKFEAIMGVEFEERQFERHFERREARDEVVAGVVEGTKYCTSFVAGGVAAICAGRLLNGAVESLPVANVMTTVAGIGIEWAGYVSAATGAAGMGLIAVFGSWGYIQGK